MQISLWDVRSGKEGALARTALPPYAALHTMALSSAHPHLLASAGSHKGVSVMDLRMLKQVQRAHLGKSDITFVSFLQSDADQCVAAGLDLEVGIAAWETPKGDLQVRDLQVRGTCANPHLCARWLC